MDSGSSQTGGWSFAFQSLGWQKSRPCKRRQAHTNDLDSPLAIGLQDGVLAGRRVGDRLRLVALNCGEANNRLMAMGLMPGAVVEVISSTPTGCVMVALHEHRLGVGAEMARLIQVTAVDDSFNPLQGRSPESQPAPSDASPLKLRDAAIGTTLRVVGYEPTGRDYKRKLLSMGLTPGATMRVTRHAPLGDPTQIEVRGFQLSLRKLEADALIVEAV